MKHQSFGLALLLISSWMFTDILAADSPSKPSSATPSFLFQIHGSNTIGARLGPELVKTFLKTRGCERIDTRFLEGEEDIALQCVSDGKSLAVRIASKGSSTGFKAMNRGEADIVASSRQVKEKEIKQLARFGNMKAHDAETVVALDAVAIIVNSLNPVEALSINSIARIFQGQIGNWSRVGEGKGSIRLLARDKASGTRDTFDSLVLGKGVKIYNRHTAFVSNEELSDGVAADKNAIGFTSFSTIGNNKALTVSMAGGAGISPTPANISTEDYPLARRLYFYMPAKITNPDARAFLKYVKTEAAQAIVARSGFIPLTVKKLKAVSHTTSSRYSRATRGYERLSVNIRFSKEGKVIDSLGQQSIKRLARFMGENDGTLLLLGFYGLSEGKNDRQFSAQAAAKVSTALINTGVRKSRIIVRGLGDERLLSTGRRAKDNTQNIRVEVWFKPWLIVE
ncbi:substrate-binding domain-containing protein [Sansalvadorimonas verongulae]|uniref:substrate-binding domain-containing protein n=1 Tax=Sansalvadorimonas verongulae TaxID=2172824 RepID=UPI0012BB72C8|nr:substrate-binding domain-containing protein [Sansalvadorimonas verongulae]MTI15512.1 hypothetical protein [Sansalvadorimonas verongulae]